MTLTFAEAVAAHHAGDFETARRGYEAFLPKRNALQNLAVLYGQNGFHPAAEQILRLILDQYPNDLWAQFTLADSLLASGQFEEGWRLFEARRQFTQNTVEPTTSAPEWLGEDPAGKRIVVCGEQGHGDQIQFARYAWALRCRGADVVYAAHPALCALFADAGLSAVPFWPHQRSIPACDAWVFVCSLPYRLALSAPIPPVRLGPPPRGGGGVGVMPSGSAANINNTHRLLPAEQATKLLTMGRDLRPEATGAQSYAETAEIIAGLDLVITVDTSVAHLGASMSVPTWVLLPAFGTDWRWPWRSAESDWYPSVKVFRQESLGDWSSVLATVAREVRAIRYHQGTASEYSGTSAPVRRSAQP